MSKRSGLMVLLPRRFASALCLLGGASSCQLLFGYEDFEPDLRATAGCASSVEPGIHGPNMTEFARADGSCFWMDRTEVTASQYDEFLRATPPAQREACSWNEALSDAAVLGTPGFQPDESCRQMVSTNIYGGDDVAITCVDWCDAFAFCEWAGKELCRDVAVALPSMAESDWVSACAGKSGTRLYGCEGPCGASSCNGGSMAASMLAAVGSFESCVISEQGGNVFDLSGNAAEWTGACASESADAPCIQRGGSYLSEDGALECSSWTETPRWRALPTVGFRCCAEAG